VKKDIADWAIVRGDLFTEDAVRDAEGEPDLVVKVGEGEDLVNDPETFQDGKRSRPKAEGGNGLNGAQLDDSKRVVRPARVETREGSQNLYQEGHP